ncbi:MAG: hypothetical protein ACRDG8_00170 [Actinomycetota bacterium]
MDDRIRHRVLIVGAAVLALLSIGAGALIALSDDDERAADRGPTPSPTATSTTPSTSSTTRTPVPSASAASAPPASESPILEDGRHFVYVTRAARLEDGSATVTFDLAYFLVGDEAEEAAAAHDDEFVNDFYIVNDNQRLRTLPLADEVRVRYFPIGQCCEMQRGDMDAWLESIRETSQTDYEGMDVPWWLTIEDGTVTRIEQHFLP